MQSDLSKLQEKLQEKDQQIADLQSEKDRQITDMKSHEQLQREADVKDRRIEALSETAQEFTERIMIWKLS